MKALSSETREDLPFHMLGGAFILLALLLSSGLRLTYRLFVQRGLVAVVEQRLVQAKKCGEATVQL